ncbi:MAG: molybdopterin molybdotransferase MoeA [Alphaproteobacteria bacterium]|nr:molybdopterin molybdotransferase MoeA [Alphaproteobacteria bacterium]
MALTPVDDAKTAILNGVRPTQAENVGLAEASGRILARNLKANRDQPPFAASAMDGYAVIGADVDKVPARLKVIGVAPAGQAFKGRVKAGQTVRIFTGAPLPAGSDTVVIQENCQAHGAEVDVLEAAKTGQFVRAKGLDFKKGEALLKAGQHLGARELGLAAAMNHATVPVRRRPRVALMPTGDELVTPGTKPRADQIVSSNNYALAALVRRFGGEPVDLGIVPDDKRALARAIKKAADCDVLVTLGGASVGDHDLVQDALKAAGLKLTFYKIAMRPGKPLMFGKLGRMRVLGLPGNPVSSIVCARLFLKPLLDAYLGLDPADPPLSATLKGSLPENDQRQDYLRATLATGPDGSLVADPFGRQDSSMLRRLTESDCLVIRPPFAPAAKAGAAVKLIKLDF